MLRLIHNQTVLGALLVDDIDDGLPNKTKHRLGSMANPDAYARDGYANEPKQPCYIPFNKPGSTTIPGYIDLRETERVVHSAGKGKIKGLSTVPAKITVVNFVITDLATPTVAPGGAVSGVPGAGDLTITGTKFLSLTPNESYVVITGTGAVTLSRTAILAAGGVAAFTDTSIVIPAALILGVVPVTSFVQVTADDNTTPAVVVV